MPRRSRRAAEGTPGLGLASGAMVCINGLQARAELNGLVGRVVRYVPERDSSCVELAELGHRGGRARRP